MAESYIYTTIDNRKLKLSNPEKILYPGVKISKAEIIQYLLETSPLILPHISRRPLTLIRYPDGVKGKTFYSKNKPTWAPGWVESTLFPGDNDNHYILANNKATLAWIGNLAGLEIHPMNVKSPNLMHPDQFIFDLDPSEEIDFSALKELAFDLKVYLKGFGYFPFIKTSGGKGLHIYVPIKPLYSQQDVFQSVKKLASEYVTKHHNKTTLKITKKQRQGKVLLDIYRNHKAQSCISPYSLRGKIGAPISTPFPWEILDSVKNSQCWNLRNIKEHLEKHGNVWNDYRDFAAPLHDQSVTHPIPDLERYNQKRNFDKTSEPQINELLKTPGNSYVVQLHDASNLHYDLRLEFNGTLESWAIPKGIPHRQGIKRLAIKTENHPLKYLTFEGKIPESEYGGGKMWIFDKGTFKTLERKSNKIHFRLQKGDLSGEYLIYHTKKNQWLLEKKKTVDINEKEMLLPMLASSSKIIPDKSLYSYEIKWDGIRAIFIIDSGKMKILSRNGNDISDKFPELTHFTNQIEAEKAIIDGEIVYLDEKGAPDFSKVVGRIHLSGKTSISKASKRQPSTAYLFDIIYLDGKDCRIEPCEKRRSWLHTILDINERIRYSESFEDGKELFNAITSYGMEGIMCKKKISTYQSGVRSQDWLKVKVRKEDTAFIIGWTEGQGDRSGMIGAMHLGKRIENQWQYMGKVGTGFDNKLLKTISEKLKAMEEISKPFPETIEDSGKSHWVEPKYKAEITYASMTSNSTYREPVFVKIKE